MTIENQLVACVTVRGEESFLSVSSSGQVDLWRAHDLHVLQTCGGFVNICLRAVHCGIFFRGGYRKLICSTRSFWPLRAVALCGDGCVRLISTHDGSIISTALPPSLIQHGTNRVVNELVDIA